MSARAPTAAPVQWCTPTRGCPAGTACGYSPTGAFCYKPGDTKSPTPRPTDASCYSPFECDPNRYCNAFTQVCGEDSSRGFWSWVVATIFGIALLAVFWWILVGAIDLVARCRRARRSRNQQEPAEGMALVEPKPPGAAAADAEAAGVARS